MECSKLEAHEKCSKIKLVLLGINEYKQDIRDLIDFINSGHLKKGNYQPEFILINMSTEDIIKFCSIKQLTLEIHYYDDNNNQILAMEYANLTFVQNPNSDFLLSNNNEIIPEYLLEYKHNHSKARCIQSINCCMPDGICHLNE